MLLPTQPSTSTTPGTNEENASNESTATRFRPRDSTAGRTCTASLLFRRASEEGCSVLRGLLLRGSGVSEIALPIANTLVFSSRLDGMSVVFARVWRRVGDELGASQRQHWLFLA